jgi:predicted MFS family arabinose efflux permease
MTSSRGRLVLRWLLPLAARAPYTLIGALMLVRFADEWFTFFPAGALVPIRDELDLSYAQAGVIVTSLAAGGIVGHGFTLAADFVDRRVLAGLGALAYGLCMIAFALADSFYVLTIAGLVWGASSDAFIHGCEVALVDIAEDDLAPALARVNAFGAIGDLLGPLTLAAAFALGVSWRAVFAAGGALMVLYAGWIATQPLPKPHPSPHASTPLASVLSLLRDRRILVLAVVDGLFGLLDEPFLAFTIAYLERVRGLSAAAATLVAGVSVAGGIAGYLSVELFTRRFGTRALLLSTGCVVGLAVGSIIAAPVPVVQAGAGFIFGFSGAVFYSVLQAHILGLRPGQAGATSAVVATIGLLGIGYPLLVGAVADARGLTAGLLVYAAVPMVMLALLLLYPSATRHPGDTLALSRE